MIFSSKSNREAWRQPGRSGQMGETMRVKRRDTAGDSFVMGWIFSTREGFGVSDSLTYISLEFHAY